MLFPTTGNVAAQESTTTDTPSEVTTPVVTETPPPPVATTNCYILTITSSGKGSIPTADPIKSESCTDNSQYVEGESISLSGATPDEGWQMNGWTGTTDDINTADTHMIMMPAEDLTVSVIYTEILPTVVITETETPTLEVTPTEEPTREIGPTEPVQDTLMDGADMFFSAEALESGISYIGDVGTAVAKDSGSSLVVTTTASIAMGDDIIIACDTDPNQNLVLSITDTAGNTYNQVGYVVNSGNVRLYIFAAYDVNPLPTGSSITITYNPAITARAAVVSVFRGLANSATVDQTHTGTGSSAAPSSGATTTTTQAAELLIGAIGTEGLDGDIAGTWDNSFTAGPRLGTTGGTADTNITISLGYQIVSATGAYTASKSGITSRDWAAMIATFKAGTGGPTPRITITGTPLSAFSGVPGTPSAEKTYTVSGSNLTNDITITAPTDFQVSLNSGSGFASSLVLSQSGGLVADTPIYVRFNRATDGTSSGNITHASSGATARNVAVSGTATAPTVPSFENMLGRPTNHSVTFNLIPNQNVDVYIKYGTVSGSYPNQTVTYTPAANIPLEFVVDGLSANTRYFYRIVSRVTGTTDWTDGQEYSFITQRPSGSTFTFTITSDSHLGQYGGQTADEKSLYQQALQNVAADHPDFHLDLGDMSAMDPSPLGTGMTEAEAKAAYAIERPDMNIIGNSAPVFLAIGNHENEEGWNFDDVFTAPDQSLAIVGLNARKLYYPNPVPDSFYSGNTDPLPQVIGGDTNREDYYAWTWGDALFVVLDPYQYSMKWPGEGGTYGGEGQDGEVSGDRWDWTLGIKQYLWFKDMLENSHAKYKFVFSHHVTGGSTPYGRGGISAAPYFEWGGENADGTWGWDTHRPASEGWDLPIHQLMVKYGVNVYFHGHDHIYAREELDGIVYLECPKPDDAGYAWDPYGYGETEGLYPDAIQEIQNSGHIRVIVSPSDVKIDYVRAYLPGDGNNGTVADTVTVLPGGTPNYSLTVAVDPVGGGTTDPAVGVHSYPAGDTANVTATPASGYEFDQWSGACTGSGTCSIPMNTDKSVTAHFKWMNTAPIANNQSVTTIVNTALGIVFIGSDAESDPLVYTVLTQPGHGTLTGTAPNLTYTPAANYIGSDSFTFKVNDGELDSNTATISITVSTGTPPQFPSSFYGEIHISDNPPAQGNTLEVYVSGVTGVAASTTIQTDAGKLVYAIDIPQDDGIGPKQSGTQGDPITFKINSRVVATSVWHGGTNIHLDIHPPQAVPGGPYSGTMGAAISFIGAVNDWGSDAATYQWDWNNDGVYDETAQNPSHTWNNHGDYPIRLKVVDIHGGEGTATVTVTVNNVTTVTHSIDLISGWNLVSFNVHPANTSITAVLGSIAGNYDLVYAWDATKATDNWTKYDTGVPYGNSLNTLDETTGFWIHMTAADILEVTGTVPAATNIPLSATAGGWNLVSYPSAGAGALPAALGDHGVGTDFSLVYAYHANDISDVWKLFDRSAPEFTNDPTELNPGWSYWVKVSANHTWHVEY
jgi:hypothetical protein